MVEEYVSEAVKKGRKGQYSESGYWFTFPEHPRIPKELWGKEMPIIESTYDMLVEIHKKHYKYAIVNDGLACPVSYAFTDRYDMDMCFIGSSNHAFHHMAGGDQVIHSIIRKYAGSVRDGYDTVKQQILGRVSLHKPPPSLTLDAYHNRQVKHRSFKKKNGNCPRLTNYEQTIVKEKPAEKPWNRVKPGGPGKRKTREVILGIPHRPTPPVYRKDDKSISK